MVVNDFWVDWQPMSVRPVVMENDCRQVLFAKRMPEGHMFPVLYVLALVSKKGHVMDVLTETEHLWDDVHADAWVFLPK